MINLVPDMDAEVIPEKSAAGFDLGMLYDDFIKNVKYEIIDDIHSFVFSNKVDEWIIYYRDEISMFDHSHINEIHCLWGSSIELVFEGDEKSLTWIYLNNKYEGKLLNILGIGDRLDLAKDDFNFYFEGDAHYLEFKKDSIYYGEIVGVEIFTNYRVEYSEEYPDQIVEGFGVYMIKEHQSMDGPCK